MIYDENGTIIAEGPAIGKGYRWRHQLAVAPFGENGELELAAVRTPHIGGVVEFYRLNGDDLQIAAELYGFSSHEIGSRNLNMAAAGDFDGDGRTELLVPDLTMTTLRGIRRHGDGADEVWFVPVEGKITTNLAAATLLNGSMIVGVGRADGVLRLWLP